MRYLSICSGIEAATVAWHGFGWEPVGFSEIEPFPSAVLAHHYPEVPNLGDMTKFKEWQVDAFDVLVGGTPCQAFSVAGLRQSLDDARGNLSLVFCEMADHFDPDFVVWENVPGVLNTKDNAFGCFLAGLAGEDVPLVAPGGKWTNAGFVLGPKRNVAWRVLDAQYFGLAQRRRRVFVVACPRDGADPREILFEREGLQRHSAPSREKGEGTSSHVGGCPDGGSLAGTVSRKWSKGSGEPAGDECYNMVAFAQAGHFGGNQGGDVVCITGPITHALKADGFDGSEDGTGRGNPIVFHPTQDPIHSEDGSCHALGCGSKGGTATHAVAFNVFGGNKRKDRPEGGFYVEENPDATKALDATGGLNPSCSQGGVCVAFHQNQRAEVTLNDTAGSLKAQSGMTGKGDSAPCVAFPIQECHVSRANIKGTGTGLGGESDPMFTLQSAQPHGVATAMQVRRLVCEECEALQGFPRNYTRIPWRNKPAEDCPDGPRYRSLGNSMAVPVMRWLGGRVSLVYKRRVQCQTL